LFVVCSLSPTSSSIHAAIVHCYHCCHIFLIFLVIHTSPPSLPSFSPLSIVINHKYHLLHHPFMYPMFIFIIVVIFSSCCLSSLHLHHHCHPFTFVYCHQSSSSRYLCSQCPLSAMDQNTQIACNGFSHAKTPCMRYH